APAAAEDNGDTAAHAPTRTRATDGRPWPPHELGMQRKRQEQSDRRLAEVARALEAQRQVHALLSHELRTPAATISAAAQSLEIILAGSGQEVDSRLARIRRAVTRMIELMNQVLSPERLRDQALTLRPEPIELGELARDTVEGMRLDTAHPLVLNAEAAVPAWCDPLLTALVLRNLIHNAVKYSPADQPVHIDVGLSYGAHGATAWVAVTDHGPGISDDESQRIFEEHYRRAAHRETPGSGLGLHLARQICQSQDGTLTVQTQLGQGARFVMTLPTPGQAYTDGGNAQAANT
ncbi:sensor histidine kinase, partial [Bordetella pertussis]